MVVGLAYEGGHGAIDYALRRCLLQPAKIRVVRTGQDGAAWSPVVPPFTVLPFAAVDLAGEPGHALVDETRRAEAIVLETSRDDEVCADDPVLMHVRQHAHCEVVEVDAAGHVIRISEPYDR
ncbi:hypothetical protein BH09ACT10_BH09ACT10_06280 [soil metagenome]